MMKKKLNVVIATTLLATLLTALLTGCGGSTDKKDAAGAASGDVTLKMWTIATESDSFYNAFNKAITEYEAENPGVKIEMETFENESYKTKIKSSIAANEIPDIYFTWGGGFSEAFVEAGKALPLDSYYDAYKNELPESQLKYATYNGSIYGVTYSTPISGIFYNKKLFDDNGVKIPETWDELVTSCQALKEKGITPFGVSVKDTWVYAMLNDALTLKCTGDKEMADVFMKQGGSYNSTNFLDAAQKMQELIDIGAFDSSAAGVTNDEAVASFFAGKSAMYVTGSWLGGQISALDNAADFDFAPFPVCSDKATIKDFMGGSADMLVVNPESEYKDASANAAFGIAKLVYKYSCLDGAGIAAWTEEFSSDELNAITQTMAGYVSTGTSFTVWSGSLMDADDYGEYQSLLQEFFVGNLDAQGFVEAMDAQLSK